MSARNDDELLSAWLDGELNPTQEEIVRRRLEEEPELAAELESLRKASDAAKSLFDHEVEALPDFRDSREAFIRTTLSGAESGETIIGPAPRARRWWQRPWPQVAAGTLLLVTTVFVTQWLKGPQTGATVFRDAAEAALLPEQFISVDVQRSSLLGRRPPMHVLYGPGGQWVVRARDTLRVAGHLAGRPDLKSIRVRHRGNIHIGSDGDQIWMWLEGEDVVKVVETQEPLPLMQFFRGFLDEGQRPDQSTPLLHWGRVRDILEGVVSDRLSYEEMGEDFIANERLIRYDVRLDEKVRSRLWINPDDKAVRRVQFGLLTLTFSVPNGTPEADVFHWTSCAPKDVRVEKPGQ